VLLEEAVVQPIYLQLLPDVIGPKFQVATYAVADRDSRANAHLVGDTRPATTESRKYVCTTK